jgi:glycosyltransferase involved in cell wall biosynthesis
MIEFLAGAAGVSPLLLASRADYAQVRPHLAESTARLPVHYLPSSERLVRAALISTQLVNVERWSGAVDWVYAPKEQPIATRARLAVTLHDVLAFEREVPGLARGWRPIASLRWRLLMYRMLQRADLIATVSEFTRRRLIELFTVQNEERVIVVGNGVAACYFAPRQQSDADTLTRFGIKCEEYLITVGSLTFRKGGDLLLDFAERLRRERLPWRLVLTGRRHDPALLERYKALRQSMPEFPLDLPGYVSDEEQAILVRNALAMLFPSRYEGFGIPVLEAMAAGTPVICSRAGALPEVAGNAAVLIETTDQVDEWVEVVRKVADDSQLSQTLAEHGRRRARKFTWQDSGSRLLRAMSDLS